MAICLSKGRAPFEVPEYRCNVWKHEKLVGVLIKIESYSSGQRDVEV